MFKKILIVFLFIMFVTLPVHVFAGSNHQQPYCGEPTDDGSVNNFNITNKNTNSNSNKNTNTNLNSNSNKNTNLNTNINTNLNNNMNINSNKNTNNNMNVNKQNQDQRQNQNQTQGQIQGQGQNQGQQQKTDINIEDKRELLKALETAFIGLANYQGVTKPGYTYQTLDEMLKFGNIFTRAQLEEMAGHRGIRPSVVDVTLLSKPVNKEKKDSDEIVIYSENIPSDVKVDSRKAFITVAMKSVKGISVECVGKAGLAALNSDANAMFLTAEGYDITQSQHAFSAGPGFSYSKAMPNAGAAGGTGLSYSYGVWGKNYKPYTRFTALKVKSTKKTE